MICERDFGFANVNWNAAFKTPELLQYLIPESRTVPAWLVDLREEKPVRRNPSP